MIKLGSNWHKTLKVRWPAFCQNLTIRTYQQQKLVKPLPRFCEKGG